MAVTTTPLGFQKPDGNEPVRNGDNVIAANAQRAEDEIQGARGRLNAIEAKNTTQDNRLNNVEAKNTTQDGTLATHAARLANLDNAAGFTGDPLALNDAAFAETLKNGDATHTALDARLAVQVPPVVNDTISKDPTVAQNAATLAQSAAGLLPVWKANTAYAAGQRVVAPSGDVVSAKVSFTSGAAYSATNWNASTQAGRIDAVETLTANAAPFWKPGTAYAGGARVVAPNGDIVAAKTAFTSGTSYDPTNWNASTQAGKLASVESTAVFNGDQRLLDTNPINDLLFAVVGKDDRRTWVEAGLDGKPTKRAGTLVGDAIGVTDVQLDNGVQFAVVDKNDRIIFTPPKAESGYTKLQHPTDDWAHWGDSMTDNRALGAEAWTNKLSVLTGRSHYNGGIAGQKAAEIAARQGGLPALVTLPGDTIPASGSVTLASIINDPVRVNTSLQVFGTLAGVPGYLQEAVDGVQTFTRTSDGIPTPCPPKTRFIPDDGQNYRNRTVTIWVGRNNIFDGTTAQQVVSAIRAQIDFLGPDVKRAIVISVPSGEGLTATHATLAAFNKAIREAFPAHWLDLDSWLKTTDAAAAAGITFTADDNADIAAGITPRSFRADYTHLNPAGATAVAYRVRLEAQNRGWL